MFNIDGLKGIFTSHPIGIPDGKMGNVRREGGGDTEMPEGATSQPPTASHN